MLVTPPEAVRGIAGSANRTPDITNPLLKPAPECFFLPRCRKSESKNNKKQICDFLIQRTDIYVQKSYAK